jgi:D-3-phosphoglycerate dehydrogenase / 2-oxoglutarate reductase
MAAYKVLIPQQIVEEGKTYLINRGYEIKMGSGDAVEDIKKDVVDCHAILARTASFPAEVLESGKNLKVIARHGVGVDNIDINKATELGIYVTNAPESNSNTVSELALGFIIALARNLILSDKATRAGDFTFRNRKLGLDLEGKTLGVLGLGKIGRRLALKAYYGLAMRVIGYDPFLEDKDFPDEVEKIKERDTIFSESDFVSIHIPRTAQTKQSIGLREFKLMKKTAFFINLARGDLVVEKELIQALQEGIIAGGGVDVYETEPPPKDHPLFRLDNIIVTPHNAALTHECMARMAVHAAQGIDEVLSGKFPTWPVNRPRKTKR